MITIEIPVWMQWAALGLAVAYAVPKALRVMLVAGFWLSNLLTGYWPAHAQHERGEARASRSLPIRGNAQRIWFDLTSWALGIVDVRDGESERSALELERKREEFQRGAEEIARAQRTAKLRADFDALIEESESQ